MNERDNRLKTIRGIIGSSRIASQEQLLGLLEAQGWSITQATLSRDLKALQVAKVPGGEGGYYYTLSGKGNGNTDEEPAGELVEDFRRGFISLAFSGNLGIVRTLAGHANSVAIALDRLNLPEILGTIAGDDTILLILPENTSRTDLLNHLEKIVGKVEVL